MKLTDRAASDGRQTGERGWDARASVQIARRVLPADGPRGGRREFVSNFVVVDVVGLS